MTSTENPIMEYLHTILERTDQLVEDVSDLRHRMARLEKFMLEQKQKMSERTSSKDSKDSKDDTKQLVKKMNVLSKDPERLKRAAKALGICEESFRLRIQRLTDAIEESHGETVTKLNVAEAQMMCCIE